MRLTDERIIKFLEKRNEGKNFDLDKFLSPSEKDLRDANKLKNMSAACEKIKKAIAENKKILVYGDYDSDGICSSTILYLYFKSCGANVDVYIPNRFENGYGISIEAIEEIQESFMPDLIVTVDLGITAIEEVEILKQEGIDIVVTDHHIPLEEIPDCICVDPKLESDYGFDALCGAGVAMKLVEAMAGREEANKYLDIAAIATVGDIVPLVDENRAIAKLGIDKINKGDCLKSIYFMLKKLEFEKVCSTDISFKIVPRLNACGRMDNAIKVFEFLIETNEKLLEEKYAEIESDNTLRLASIDKGNKIIDKCLKNYDRTEPSVLVNGDFHEGIIGILASRVCHEFNKPAIIFTKTEDGTLKGSGRSIESIDVHKIISSMSDLLVNFGGHKMAIGVEIEESAFDEFKRVFNEKISEVADEKAFLVNNFDYDIEIFEDDLDETFYRELSLLEPFGCENEKPVLALKQKDVIVEPMSEKVFKHYRCFTSKNIPLVSFNFYKHAAVAKSKSDKMFIVELGENSYKGKTKLSVLERSLKLINPDFSGLEEVDFLTAIFNKYYSVMDFNNKENYHVTNDVARAIKDNFLNSTYGTIIVASTNDDLEKIKALNLGEFISDVPFKNGQNVVVANPTGIYNLDDVNGYKNIIFLHKSFDEEHLYFSQKLNVFEPEEKVMGSHIISKDRQVFAKCYNLITNNANLKANDEIDFASKLSLRSAEISASQILFSLLVFMELNFLEFDPVLNSVQILKSKKMELSSSKFYQSVE
ncbi:MAG: single-stranded-DNA-specific exonuclease RecJ [Clostridia bacterium]|nr:single-stranded-DNA-specific exonuclease RecJ [Clostridia bacterium]